MYVGSTLYVLQISKLAKPMKLSRVAVLFSLFNACWPATLWTVSLACLLDEYPLWLLEGLRRVESHLPSVLHASLFFDPPALYPVCKLLHGVVAHEEARLQTARRHAAGGWSLTKPNRGPLSDLDVASIVVRRLAFCRPPLTPVPCPDRRHATTAEAAEPPGAAAGPSAPPRRWATSAAPP